MSTAFRYLACFYLPVLFSCPCLAEERQLQSTSALSGRYTIGKFRNTGYPAHHADFIHVLKWKRDTDVIVAVDSTNSLTVVYETKSGILCTNMLSLSSGGYELKYTNGLLDVTSEKRERGYMMPGTVTVSKRFIFRLNADGDLLVESTYVEKGRAFGVLPWEDDPDKQMLLLRRKPRSQETGVGRIGDASQFRTFLGGPESGVVSRRSALPALSTQARRYSPLEDTHKNT